MVQTSDVVLKICEDILSGELPFGSRLTIGVLSSRYQVSHMPIREALRILHGEGLLTVEPNKGARVRSVDPEFIGNIFNIRCALTVMLIKKAVVNATEAQIAELWEIERRLEQYVEQADYASALQANREFHAIIHLAANNPDAVAMLDRHWLLISALWRRYDYGAERLQAVVNDHRHLLRALENRDPDDAGALMQAHVIKAKHALLAHVMSDANMQAVAPKRRRRRAESAENAGAVSAVIDDQA